MLFSEIPGLDSVKSTLIRSVKNSHVAHALLFDSPLGGGGLAMAWAFATYVNCENKLETDACGSCASCNKTRKLIHPDLHNIFPIATSKLVNGNTSEAFLPEWRNFLAQHPYPTLPDWLNHINADNKQGNISVEEARGILKKLSLKSFEGEYKILIIWKPELMNLASANALLKILEEPPSKTLFLLVSDQPDKLLTTIISRTQLIKIPAFSDRNVVDFLGRSAQTDPTAANKIAFLVDGNLSEAQKLARESSTTPHDWFANWMRTCFRFDAIQLIRQSDEFDGMSKEAQKGIFDYTLKSFRDMFIWMEGAGALIRSEDEQLNFIKNFSKTVDPARLEKMVGEVNHAYFHIERNVRAKMVFLDLSLTLARYFKRG